MVGLFIFIPPAQRSVLFRAQTLTGQSCLLPFLPPLVGPHPSQTPEHSFAFRNGGGGAEKLWSVADSSNLPGPSFLSPGRGERWDGGAKGCARWMGPGEGQGNQSVTEEQRTGRREARGGSCSLNLRGQTSPSWKGKGKSESRPLLPPTHLVLLACWELCGQAET